MPNITFAINYNRKKDVKTIENLIQPQFKIVDFPDNLIIATKLKYWPINYNDDWKNFKQLIDIINTKIKPRFEVNEVLSTNFCPEMEISPTIQLPFGKYNDAYRYQDKNGNEFSIQCLGNRWQGYQWNPTQIQAIKNHIEQQKLTTVQEEITTTTSEKTTENEEITESHESTSSITSSNRIETTTAVQSKAEKSTEIVRVSKSVTFPSEPTEDTTMIDPYLNTKTNSEVLTRTTLKNFAITTRSPEDEINEDWNSFHQLTALHNNMSDVDSIQNFATTLTEVTKLKSEKFLPPLANSLENIVSENEKILDELQRKNVSNQILESIDRLLLNVVNLGSDGFEEEVRPNIALRVENPAITQGVGIALLAAADTELRDLTTPNSVLQSLDRASNSESIHGLSPL
ncbi:hypothetical protein B566_EDAN004505 [Ephemera danica]|nr:hypothetical protein B566_EDAN004505 [Ephemera danica]